MAYSSTSWMDKMGWEIKWMRVQSVAKPWSIQKVVGDVVGQKLVDQSANGPALLVVFALALSRHRYFILECRHFAKEIPLFTPDMFARYEPYRWTQRSTRVG
jgi:hypothetical protein